MATSVTPALIDALYTQATAALTGITVYDGFGVSDVGRNTLWIGVDDPDTEQDANSSDAAQVMATMGTNRTRDQTGAINCTAIAWTGSRVQKTSRDAVYAILAGVENLLRADPTLGIGQPGRVVIQLGDELLTQGQYDNGSSATVKFTVAFKARI